MGHRALGTSPTREDLPMSQPTFDLDACSGCGTCIDECPNGCLDLGDTASLARPGDCSECGTCAGACPNGAITV